MVLARGPDLNAKDSHGNTPLNLALTNCASGNFDILIEHGADKNILFNCDRVYSSLRDQMEISFFGRRGYISGQTFGAFLSRKKSSEIFKTMISQCSPRDLELIKENLAENLSLIVDVDKCEMLGKLEFKDHLAYLALALKNQSLSWSAIETHRFLPSALDRYKNELLHVAILCDDFYSAKKMIEERSANPNSLAYGLPPLFRAKSSNTIQILLSNGANPFFQVDGCKFFQRRDFKCEGSSTVWLLYLHRLGINLFEASTVTGKNFFQSSTDTFDFQMVKNVPAEIITEALFDQLIEHGAINITPIDSDGNTLLHFHILKQLRIYNYCSYLGFFVFQTILDKNKAGLTPMDLLLRSEDFCADLLDGIVKLEIIQDLQNLEIAYNNFHGKDSFDANVLRKIGMSLFVTLAKKNAE